MYEDDFRIRLAKLRDNKRVSARDMSLSIGQNAGYINNIENGKSLPSMSGFFYICDYLGLTPREFFDIGTANPQRLNEINEKLKKLNDRQLRILSELIDEISD